MPSFVYNKGAYQVANQALNWDTNTGIKCLLVTSGYTAAKTHNFVSDLTEVSVSGYARQAMAAASNTITEDDTNHRIVFDGPDVTFTSLAAGQTIGGAVVADTSSGNDATSPLICFIDLTDTATNGGNVTITWSADGIFYLQQ